MIDSCRKFLEDEGQWYAFNLQQAPVVEYFLGITVFLVVKFFYFDH